MSEIEKAIDFFSRAAINGIEQTRGYMRLAATALREKAERETRTQPGNLPLTLEQLRQMDNKPVWTDRRCGVVRADPQITRRPGMPVIHFNYGWEWVDDVLACGPIYAHKPEKSGAADG
jgi:hypothetical protein